MKKGYVKILLGISIFLLIGMIGILQLFQFRKSNGMEGYYSYEEAEDAHYWVTDEYILKMYESAWEDVEVLGYGGARDFLSYCAECIQYLCERTGKTEWMNGLTTRSNDGKAIVTIATVHKDVTSRTTLPEGKIYLNKRNIQSGKYDIEHELTHLIMGAGGEITMSEGFATYMEFAEFGTKKFEYYGININVLLQNLYLDPQYEDWTKDILAAVGAAYDPSVKHQKHGWVFYMYAGSFVKYMVDTYGMESVIGIYDAAGDAVAYEKFTGKEMHSIKADWLEYLKQYDGEMSADEIIAILSE